MAASCRAHRHPCVHAPPRPSPPPGLPAAPPPAPTLPPAERPLRTWPVSGRPGVAGGPPTALEMSVPGRLSTSAGPRLLSCDRGIHKFPSASAGGRVPGTRAPGPAPAGCRPLNWKGCPSPGWVTGHRPCPKPVPPPQPDAVLGSTCTSRETENSDLETMAEKPHS